MQFLLGLTTRTTVGMHTAVLHIHDTDVKKKIIIVHRLSILWAGSGCIIRPAEKQPLGIAHGYI